MDIRYSASPRDVKRYTTQELRDEFLITGLYEPDTVRATYSHVDRMVVMGIMPVKERVPIDKGIDVWANFGTHFSLERRAARAPSRWTASAMSWAMRTACTCPRGRRR